MKIPVWLLAIALGGVLSLEAWTLSKVVALAEDVAEIKGKLSAAKFAGYSQPETVAANKQ
jgi:hypothetical protein